jgi:mycothiol synthase
MLAAMNAPAAHSIAISRCDPAADKLALALAASAWPEDERSSRWQALAELVRAQQAADILLLAAHRDDRLVAASIAQFLPGRTAVTWLPQFTAPSDPDQLSLTDQFHAQLRQELVARGVDLVQGLEPCDHQPTVALREAAGFIHAADLLYLGAEVDCFPVREPALPFETECFEPTAAERLQRLIDRTYEQTLDCPQMDGLRETSDVIAGYRAIGEFRPELWRIARYSQRDVGCLLMNVHGDADHAEIVYLGIAPEARGRGYGLALTRLALWLTRELGCERVVLAVDAANDPAISMYAAAGFSPWDKKAVWIQSLRSPKR